MPLRSKKRRSSTRSYETKTPDPKQRHLASPNRIIKQVKHKTPATASNSKKQDTLTQRGFDLHPYTEDVDLAYSDGSDGAREKNSPKKRRKTMTQTLTQGGFILRQDPEDLNLVYEGESDILSREMIDRRKRRKVIPKEPVMRLTRSAGKRLVEKNVKLEEDNRGKRSPKVEFDIEDHALRMPRTLMPPPKTPQSSRREEVPSSQSPVDTPPSSRVQPSTRDLIRSPLKERSTNVRRTPIPQEKNFRRPGMLEVADSMDYKYDDDGCMLPTLSIPVTIPLRPEKPADSKSNSVKDFTNYKTSDEVSTHARQSLNVGVNRAKHETRIMKTEVSDTDAEEEDDEDEELDVFTSDIQNEPKPQITTQNSTSNLVIHEDDPTPTKYAQAPTDSSKNSTTTHPSLRKTTHQPSHPPHNLNPNSSPPQPQPQPPTNPHALSSPISSIPFHHHHPLSSPSSSNPPTNQTHPPPTPCTKPQSKREYIPSTPLPIPSSQATTTDITQSSPLHIPSSGAGEDLGTWDGVRLTDSQLLPDSILNDGLGVPVLEGWGLEGEGEGEEE